MDREQYLREVEARLSNHMPGRELEGVMGYYEEYFDELGPERVDEAISSLGSPSALVERILGSKNTHAPKSEVVDLDEVGYQPPRRGLSAVWKVILAICAAPIAIPLMIGLVALAVGLLVAIVALFAGLALGGVACVVFGVGSAVVGFSSILLHGISTTMVFVGGGMLSAGIGVLLVAAAVAITGVCLRGLAGLLRRALYRREGQV